MESVGIARGCARGCTLSRPEERTGDLRQRATGNLIQEQDSLGGARAFFENGRSVPVAHFLLESALGIC